MVQENIILWSEQTPAEAYLTIPTHFSVPCRSWTHGAILEIIGNLRSERKQFATRISPFSNPRNWNLDCLIDKYGIRKPRIDVLLYVVERGNSAGDLRLSFRTIKEDFKNQDDYNYYNIFSVEGFIRHLYDLINCPMEQRNKSLRFVALSALFAIRASFNEFVEMLRVIFDVNCLNDFDFFYHNGQIRRFCIYSVPERENNKRWLREFKEKYGLTKEKLLSLCYQFENYSRIERSRKIRMEFEKEGIKKNLKEIKDILRRFEENNSVLLEKHSPKWFVEKILS